MWINKHQYFENVPEVAWNFWIGGYQPAQKWLKDRRGRALGAEISSRIGVEEDGGVVLDLGSRSIDWLIANRASGYIPRRLAQPMIDAGRLAPVEEAPVFALQAYLGWRAQSEENAPELFAKALAANYSADSGAARGAD